MFKCTVCGYVADSLEGLDKCPKCGAAIEKFDELDNDAGQKIERSRFTNGLHVQLMSLLEEVINLSEDGIQDDLDPNCVKVFTRAQKEAEILIQMVKAELEGHMKKNKWG